MEENQNLFPSTFEKEKNKASKDYLLKYGQTMWQAAESQSTSVLYDQRRDRFLRNRKYSEGLQSVEKFKSQLSVTGDNTYLNIDWGVSTPLPKMVEVIRGQMINQPYKIDFKPTDSLSKTEYDREKQVLRAKMKMQEELAPLVEQGVIPKEKNLPEDDDELEIYMTTNFKLAQSIALENITDAILEDNDIEYINEQIAKDLVDLKICAVRVCLDENKNICLEYVDPVNLVTSYVKKPDFSDAKHIGVLKRMTIEDLRVQSAGELSEEDLMDIAKNVAGKYDNPSWDSSFGNDYYYNSENHDAYNKFQVLVLDFEMFSTDKVKITQVKSKNGGYKTLVNEEPRNKKAETKQTEKKIKNIYCGKYVVGTDYLYDYGLKEHIIRRKVNRNPSANTSLGFIVYAPDIHDMENKSKTEEMIPHADKLILYQLKLQQIISKAAPSGYAINMDAVSEALQGMGMGGMQPVDARAMRDQIGDIYFKSVREDGTPLTQNTPPIINLPNGLDASIQIISEAYNQELMRMKEVVGLNDAVDSSQPDKKALIGVQKLAVAAHKNALRTLYGGFLKVNEEMARQVSMLAQQLIRAGINVDKFENMVGEETVKQLDITKVPASEFSIQIKMLPDEEDKAYIESKVELALQSQPPLINLQDAFAVRRVMDEDVDKAEQLLAVREKRRAKERQKSQEEMMVKDREMELQVAQQKEAAAQQTIQIKTQMELALEKEKGENELAQIVAKGEEDRKTEMVVLQGKMKLIEKAAEEEKKKEGEIEDRESSGSSYDKIDMPEASGSRMPAMGVSNKVV